jgi:hypothetical protein
MVFQTGEIQKWQRLPWREIFREKSKIKDGWTQNPEFAADDSLLLR